MIEIELCRICLADSIRMYPIEYTRYHGVFEWYTEDTMDMNEELPYSVCYLCNAVLNKLYDFLKNMLDTEIYLKETLRNTSKLTYESVKKLKREMISKPHNLSKIWLRNSNFIALDAFKGHRPPRELRRYFEHPPIMIEYHKPYEHMKLQDIPEAEELEKINEDEPEEIKEAETGEIKEVETEEIKEAETEGIKEVETEEIKEAETDRINEAETEGIKEAETEGIKEAEAEGIKEAEAEGIKEAEAEGIKEAETEEIKEADTEVNMEVETEQNKEAKSEEIKDRETLQQKLNIPEQKSKPLHRVQKESSNQSDEKSPKNEDQQIPHEEKFKSQPDNTEYDSETTADQDEFIIIDDDDDEIISIQENITLETTPQMEIDDDSYKEINNGSEQSNNKSQSNFTNKQTGTPDSIDSFLLSAKKYRSPEIAKSYNEYVTKEAVRKNVAKNHNPYLEFIKERIGNEKEPQKKVKTPGPVKFHNPYLQFIEERIETEEKPQEKIPEISEQRVKTPHPGKYQNQNLQIIEHPVKETEPELTPEQMEIDKNINTSTPSLKSTNLAVVQLEESYYNLYLESVKETPFKILNEPLDIEKFIPVNRGPKLMKPTTDNKPAKIIVTSEPKRYINSYVDFVEEIEPGSIENARKLIKVSHEIPIPLKNTKKRNLKSTQKIVPVTPIQEIRSEIDIDGKISEYSYFNHQKKYRRASILKKTRQPHRNQREVQQLAAKIKNRAAIIRKELQKFQKTDSNAKKVIEENANTKLACNDEGQPGISEFQKENSPKHLPLKPEEHSDTLLTEIPLKLPQDNKNRRSVVKSKHTDRVSDEPKDQNQGDQDNDQADQELIDQNDGIILKDQEDVNNLMWSDDEDTMDSQVSHALKALDESLKDDDVDPILQIEVDQQYDMPNDPYNHTLTDNTDYSLHIKDVCITIEDDQEDNNKPKDQDNPSLIVHNVFTLKDQGSEDEDLIPKEQYDHIIMLANQDDQIMEDGHVAVKIESVDDEFQGSFAEEHEEENILSDTETFYNDDVMNPNNDSDDMIQHDDIKIEVEQNMQIDEEVSEYELYLQERVSPYESTTEKERAGPSNYNNPDFESNYNGIQSLNEQEHYTIRRISQITSMATVQLERLPIDLIKKINTENNSGDDDKYSCGLCDFKTNVRRAFLRHRNIHDVDKRFVCNICQHRFISHYHLSRHKVIHDRTTYFCSYCDFKTKRKFTMDNHENLHNKFNRFPCSGCQRRFRSYSHRLRHSCTKYLRKCEVCNKVFRSEARYMHHLDTHDGAPLGYKCSVCFKSFDTERKCSNHYKQHGRKDLDKRKYTCKWCKKNFSDRSNCSKHMKLHKKYEEKVSHETKYKQDMCETDDEVEIHEKERREDEKFVCSLCPKLFDTETELGQHAVDHIL